VQYPFHFYFITTNLQEKTFRRKIVTYLYWTMTSSWTSNLLQFSKQMESIKYSQEGPTLFQVCEIALSATPVAHTHTHTH